LLPSPGKKAYPYSGVLLGPYCGGALAFVCKYYTRVNALIVANTLAYYKKAVKSFTVQAAG
jgi:hypothetical protein